MRIINGGRGKIIGNLSTDVFEPRTSTGSCTFPSLEHFNAIAFVTSNHKYKNKSFAVHGKEQNHAKKENIRLPVAVRVSKTSVLKFSITRGIKKKVRRDWGEKRLPLSLSQSSRLYYSLPSNFLGAERSAPHYRNACNSQLLPQEC